MLHIIVIIMTVYRIGKRRVLGLDVPMISPQFSRTFSSKTTTGVIWTEVKCGGDNLYRNHSNFQEVIMCCIICGIKSEWGIKAGAGWPHRRPFRGFGRDSVSLEEKRHSCDVELRGCGRRHGAARDHNYQSSGSRVTAQSQQM